MAALSFKRERGQSFNPLAHGITLHFPKQVRRGTCLVRAMLLPLLIGLLFLAPTTHGLLVRHSNGSLVQFEREALEEEIDPKLIVGSYKLSNGSELLVIAEVDEGSDQYRYTCLFSEKHVYILLRWERDGKELLLNYTGDQFAAAGFTFLLFDVFDPKVN